MPMGSEQNDPTNLLGWEPWLWATPGGGGRRFFHSALALLLMAAWRNRKLTGHGALFTAYFDMEVSGVMAILGIPAGR